MSVCFETHWHEDKIWNFRPNPMQSLGWWLKNIQSGPLIFKYFPQFKEKQALSVAFAGHWFSSISHNSINSVSILKEEESLQDTWQKHRAGFACTLQQNLSSPPFAKVDPRMEGFSRSKHIMLLFQPQLVWVLVQVEAEIMHLNHITLFESPSLPPSLPPSLFLSLPPSVTTAEDCVCACACVCVCVQECELIKFWLCTISTLIFYSDVLENLE